MLPKAKNKTDRKKLESRLGQLYIELWEIQRKWPMIMHDKSNKEKNDYYSEVNRLHVAEPPVKGSSEVSYILEIESLMDQAKSDLKSTL